MKTEKLEAKEARFLSIEDQLSEPYPWQARPTTCSTAL